MTSAASQTTHTPGPWTYMQADPGELKLKRIYWHVGQIRPPEKGCAFAFGDDESNARLIAAAPDLLEALRGPDPEIPKHIQPIGWLRTLIDWAKLHADVPEKDDDAFWTMIHEVERLFENGRAAVAKAGTPQPCDTRTPAIARETP